MMDTHTETPEGRMLQKKQQSKKASDNLYQVLQLSTESNRGMTHRSAHQNTIEFSGLSEAITPVRYHLFIL